MTVKNLAGSLAPLIADFFNTIDPKRTHRNEAERAVRSVRCLGGRINPELILHFTFMSNAGCNLAFNELLIQWGCGASNGEGLSRVLATERYPTELNGFSACRIR